MIKNTKQAMLWLVLATLLSACTSITSLMFYPQKDFPVLPSELGLEFQTIHHQSSDGTKLVSWWLPAKNQPAKGSVLVLHGNAQNISYQQMSVNWLPSQGYNVFMLGYRQFGQSEGLAKLPGLFLDVHSALDWLMLNKPNEPKYILGQSIGATLAVYGLASYPEKKGIKAVVLDAAFDSYPGMAAEAMSRHWLTWLLQLPAWSMVDDYDPVDWIERWHRVPLLMFHDPMDKTVPYGRGRALFAKANEPKIWLDSSGGHVATFRSMAHRQKMLDFFLQYSSAVRAQ